MPDVVERLIRLSEVPADKEGFEIWLGMESALDFLRDNSHQDEFVIYASSRGAFIHALLAPASLLDPPDIDDLMSWRCDPSSSWGIGVRFSEPREAWISQPLDHTGSKTLDEGEQLVFKRYFDGRSDKKSYVEISQKFAHVFGLH